MKCNNSFKNRLNNLFVLLIVINLLPNCRTARAQINPANNKIAVDVSTQPQNSGFGYNSCFALGANLGMSSVGLHLTWTALETSPNTFNFSVLDIANVYYPAYNMPIDLNIDPIETNRLEVPSDLITTPFSSPVLIHRFKTLLDSMKIHLPNPSSISSLVIGTESDVYMGANATLWQQYTTFYDTVSAYARTLWAGVKISSELGFDGIFSLNTFAQTLNANSDYIGVSYYPINSNFTVKPTSVIPTDFATLASLYPSKPICFYQYGYPSSASCNSSDTQQKQFITQTFQSWDTYAANIRLIDFTWLHDLDTAVLNQDALYYGISDTVFLEFLHTLGLRTWNGNGSDKPAFVELECQAKQRGYNSLPLNCTASVDDRMVLENKFSVYPNPATDFLSINFADNKTKTTIQLFNATGMLLKEEELTQTTQLIIIDLHPGLYFIHLKNHPEQTQKFVKQ